MKPATTLAVLILALIAVAHVVRAAMGWDIVFGTHHVPIWGSVVAAVALGAIALLTWREHRAR